MTLPEALQQIEKLFPSAPPSDVKTIPIMGCCSEHAADFEWYREHDWKDLRNEIRENAEDHTKGLDPIEFGSLHPVAFHYFLPGLLTGVGDIAMAQKRNEEGEFGFYDFNVEYVMATDAAASYDALADHYHLIFEDWEASVERQAAVLSSILNLKCGPPSTARILDCACGIGIQALGLAKRGFRVHASDVSTRAVQRARLEASRKHLDIQFSVGNMLDLACFGDSCFDAVTCMDNSLPHLDSTEQLIRAAVQIRARLRLGGFFMASIRDYDRLIEEKPVVQGPSFYTDRGHRRIVFQVWDWIDDCRYIFHLYITREFEKGWQTFHTSAPYRALCRDEVLGALSQARFKNVYWLFEAESGFYQPIVLAEAA